MNYKYVAIHVGNLIKYDSTSNKINRAGASVFDFNREPFPKTKTITSVRASLFYDWVMTLAKQKMDNENRNELLIRFCKILVLETDMDSLEEILDDAKIPHKKEPLPEFIVRDFHWEIHMHSSKLFKDGHYFLAVFEATKAYNNRVKEKSKSSDNGQSLMHNVWGCKNGVLKITPCKSETDENIQRGMGFLSAGLISAFRNPAAHETAIPYRNISKEGYLDILSLVSFLFRELDKAEYYERQNEA